MTATRADKPNTQRAAAGPHGDGSSNPGAFGAAIQELPREIPVFPLNGALLLPGGRLPLNIFEDRYLNMVRDVMAMQCRVFGMIQTLDSPAPGDKDRSHRPSGPLHGIGCLGHLSSFEETGDGRYLISLDGVIRFSVVKELEARSGYRRVEASYDGFKHDVRTATPAIDRDRLLAALRSYFSLKGFSADWERIMVCECEKLVTTLSMVCPLGCADKQALLEAPCTDARADILATLLEMEVAGLAPASEGDGNAVH